MYYCRVAVPKSIQHVIGKKEIHKSLKTSDPATARELVKAASYQIDQMLAKASGRTIASLANTPPPLTLTYTLAHTHPLTFAELVERFINLPEKATYGARTKLAHRVTYRMLTELLGEDTLITNITRTDCRRVQEVFTRLPANSTKRFPNLPLVQVVERARKEKIEPMSVVSANIYIMRLASVLGWAMQEGLIAHNPALGLLLPEPEAAKDKRHPFTIEQLNTIFGSETMQRHRAASNTRWWIPILALWTGCRLSELCQLHMDDVATPDGIPALLIQEGHGKRFKTPNAKRTVPLHPMLLRLGFLEFVTSMRERGEVRLFPEMTANKRGDVSDKFSRQFAYFLKDIEVKTEKTCFHSFRHNFRDALREAETPREVVRALGGWTRSEGVEDDYGSGFKAARLYEAICKVEYAGLVL